MTNKYSLLQEYARYPTSTQIRVTNNYWGVVDPRPIHDKEYKILIKMEILHDSFKYIKKLL